MKNIKVLDCTLRDGGYVNNWEFQDNNIKNIIKNLSLAKINYIECGFLKNIIYKKDKSLFSSVKDLKTMLPDFKSNSKYTLMINFGEIPIEYLNTSSEKNFLFRIAFKKSQKDEAVKYCQKLKEKGYDIFVNPMHTGSYSQKELIDLIEKVNLIKPAAFTIVDTTGSLKEKDVLSLFYLVDSTLDKDIALCFHSHNNLQLSFSNAQCLMKVCTNRELVIDSTVFGIGRGAGNLCTELITQYINDNYQGDYNILPILKIVDEQINPIFSQTPWGYSVPYYLAATNHCHPNYAKYLVDKQTVPVEIINKLLSNIPDDKKSGYDVELIKQIYLDNFSSPIDDNETIDYLKDLLINKNILVLAPGKSLTKEKDKITKFINKKKPFIVSLNFIPKDYNADLAFITNMKRFESLDKYSTPLVISSNINVNVKNAKVINYSSYLNNSKMFDNVALMFFKVLNKISVKSINIAGLDGFSSVPSENYVENSFINNAKVDEFDKRNEIMAAELKKVSEYVKLNFITNSLYTPPPDMKNIIS